MSHVWIRVGGTGVMLCVRGLGPFALLNSSSDLWTLVSWFANVF